MCSTSHPLAPCLQVLYIPTAEMLTTNSSYQQAEDGSWLTHDAARQVISSLVSNHSDIMSKLKVRTGTSAPGCVAVCHASGMGQPVASQHVLSNCGTVLTWPASQPTGRCGNTVQACL